MIRLSSIELAVIRDALKRDIETQPDVAGSRVFSESIIEKIEGQIAEIMRAKVALDSCPRGSCG